MASKPALRFKIGDKVSANVGQWMPGTVVKLWYREEHWPDTKADAAYKIRLDQGAHIFAPEDIDKFVREPVKKIPVTILTGFLGAGKTTLLNHILKENHGKKVGIIENEFGSVSIDDKLLKENLKQSSDEAVIEMKNGCVCCTVRTDLTTAFKDLIAGGRKLDYAVIETTGMADPAPVIQTFCMDEYVSSHYRIDAVLTVVDSKHILQHLAKEPEAEERKDNEAAAQIAYADRILCNKMDLVTESDVNQVTTRIRSINPNVDIMKCTLKEKIPDLDKLLGLDAFDVNTILKTEPEFLKKEVEEDCDEEDCSEKEEEGHGHAHKHKEEKDDHGHGHGHGHAHGHEKHKHDPLVNSITLRFDGEVDIRKLNGWVQMILTDYANDIFRMKGIVAVSGSPKKFVFQGVHMVFDAQPSEEWKEDEKKESIMVFIGRKMKDKEEQFKKAFKDCIVTKYKGI